MSEPQTDSPCQRAGHAARSSVRLNPSLERLPVYQPGRPIEEVARELGLPAAGIIKLASNENPLGPSPLALKAMQEALAQAHLYPDGNAYYLRVKLARRLGVAPEQLAFGNGSNEVLELIGHAATAPDSEVVVAQYCFVVYPIVSHLFGAKLIVVPAKNYGHDLSAMLRAITPRTSAVFVANPNNPTGTLAPPEDVLKLVNEAPPRVLVVVDEAYIDFLDDPVDLLSLVRSGAKPNLVLCRSFSKTYGLAGLRIGYAVGHADFIGALEKVREPFNVNSLAQAAAVAALDDVEHVRRTRENNAAGLRFYERAFRELGWEFVPSAGNFILVRAGNGERVFMEMQKLGVIVRPVSGYGLPEWVRISIGTPAENARCLEGLKIVLRPSAK